MKSKFYKRVFKSFRIKLLLLILIGSAAVTYSQQNGLNENDIILNAQSLFDKKDYPLAMPLYAQLVSVHPDDPLFNYRFGVCALLSDRKDKKKPIKYLNNAAQTIKDDQLLYYYLGLAYHQNQEFANAMKYYNLYLSKLPSNSPDRAPVLEKVNACLNGLNMADRNLVSEIVSTSKFQKDNFHRAYAAQDFNGSLVVKPDIFVSDREKKSGENSYVYLVHPSNVLYFSGYASSENITRDIFKVEMDENGDWGVPVIADGTINTSFDENYPVLVDNGTTLFFCSKGHNSLGGYDIFRSTFDSETNSFSQPENLGPGINSPFDDIVFIPTKDKSYVYFASDRDNLNSTINVYKVKLIDNFFDEGQVLAEKMDPVVNPQVDQSTVSNDKQENIIAKENSDIAFEPDKVTEPLSDPSKKAASMVNDRTKSNALADSAFIIITTTKNLIRDLTNKRDRANAISQRKADEAKTLETRFNESIALLANAAYEEQFLLDLEKSIKFKEDVYQLQQRSAYANKIAWNLGNQVKIKNQELENLKILAGKIQSTGISSSFEETLVLYSNYKKIVTATDTLVDYSDQLVSITNNKTTFEVPQSELVFAENLKKAYKNNTLFAELNTKKPEFDGSFPIVVIDKTAIVQESNSTSITQPKPFEPIAIVEPVVYTDANYASIDPGKELLNVNFGIDNRTEPLELVESIDLVFGEDVITGIENAELEINFYVDKAAMAEVFPLVQPVYSDLLLSTIEPSETNLILNFEIDAVKPANLVLPVEYAFSGKDESFNEEIEISIFTDKIGVESILALVETVQIRNPVIQNLPDEGNLELNFTIDEIKTKELVNPVDLNSIAQNIVTADEELEISNDDEKTEQLTADAIIQPVYSEKLALNITPEEPELEIGISVDQTYPVRLIDQVPMPLLAQDQITVEEELEIQNSLDVKPVVEIANVIEPLTLPVSPSVLSFIDENIEISFHADGMIASKLIEPVMFKETNQSDIASSDNELDFTIDHVEAITIIDQIETSAIALSEIDPASETIELDYSNDTNDYIAMDVSQKIENEEPAPLTHQSEPSPEIDFAVDQSTEGYAIIEPVLISFEQMNPSTEEVEISFLIDIKPDVKFSALNAANLNSSGIAISNPVVESIKLKMNEEQVASLDEIYFLREAVMMANGIETSKSDDEILLKALNNPEDLSYEELLYAANLTDVQEEKMAIYNVTFVHIDRDWRAFNNAAVSAIHLDELSEANCYLYQASLLSIENGHIQNNMGILACHKNQFDEAGEYFVAASNLGYDAQYNLKLANGLSDIADAGKYSNQQNVKNAEKGEDVIVDIIDYKTSGE